LEINVDEYELDVSIIDRILFFLSKINKLTKDEVDPNFIKVVKEEINKLLNDDFIFIV